MDSTTPTLHDNGTVTYWSVYQQQWQSERSAVPDRELAAMSAEDRERVVQHLVSAEGAQ